MTKGYLISGEGCEGTGKTLQFNKLKDFLESQGYEVLLTREPGGVNVAEQIRTVILNKENNMDSLTEAILYAASRREVLTKQIIPALEEGKIVLCDRFVDSSLAYQGYARGLGIDTVWDLNKIVVETTMPDLTLYFDIEPEIGLRRIHADKKREVNRLDLESLEFHRKVREGYCQLLDKFPQRIQKVDASRSMEEVFDSCRSIVEQFIK